jgi:TfoX/Sxy family transcriptional regulator of competence genes
MSYWSLPDAAMDDRDEAARWARLGHSAALRAAAAKLKKGARTSASRSGEGAG